MKTIYFPGNSRQASKAEYDILMDYGPEDTLTIPKAHIVIYQGSQHTPGSSIVNSDEGRDVMLNKILANDLAGIRTDQIRFTVLDHFGEKIQGADFHIHVDIDDFVARGNQHEVKMLKVSPDNLTDVIKGALLTLVGREPVSREVMVWSYNVVGGCAKFFTSFEERKPLSETDAEAIFKALNAGQY